MHRFVWRLKLVYVSKLKKKTVDGIVTLILVKIGSYENFVHSLNIHCTVKFQHSLLNVIAYTVR